MNNKDNKPNDAGVSNDAETKTQLSATSSEEKNILEFWNKENIFQKSIDNNTGKKEFVFYDGPPFGTGIPHYGHLVPGTIKDIFPRYQTMKGNKVERNWGWDCHGLPIENMIEKEIGLNSKLDIEEYGIDKFNKASGDSVLRYKDVWEDVIPKTGRWVNMEKHYKTMDSSYMESVWWAFSELNKKGLVYKSFKPMHLCPRCETTLSNNEVADGYKDIKDLSVTAKFKLADETDTYILAWTTTPWTLPGNVAIAVGEEIDYVKVKNVLNQEYYIFAKEKLEEINSQIEGGDLETVDEFKGSQLVGKSYVPPFDYYFNKKDLKDKENGWKIWAADFVTTETGTGIVHIAPAFGQDDMKLGEDNNLPFVQHVSKNGKFKEEVTDFAGLRVRKKDFHEESDIEIIKYLAGKGLLFSKLKIEHSYPHCWRCDTPLLNYATESWFIKTTEIKDGLVAENKKVHWVPDNVGTKRFHNWLENTRDWAVSRSRYWGAPLPIWENKQTGEYQVIGSLDELKTKTKSKNNIVYIRHGQSVSNEKNMVSSEVGGENDKLTEDGINQVKESKAEFEKIYSGLKADGNSGKPDLIISSPLVRTQQTAKLLAGMYGIDEAEVITDERIRERDFGAFNGKSYNEVTKITKAFNNNQYINEKVGAGESVQEVKKRMMEFLYDIDSKYKGKNIVVVTHFTPYWTTFAGSKGLDDKDTYDFRDHWGEVHNAYPRLIDFAPIPHNENYQLDYHRPFVDQVSWTDENGGRFEAINEVFDCWFESGSMPYASKHYPFENTDVFNPKKNIGFPADFIAEGLDQTRGWFWSMLVLSYALFGKAPYKNVVVHGMLMAEDGRKMSKSLKNYPPMDKILNEYGSDALRLFLMASPIVRGESPSFSEKAVDEVLKKIVIRSKNVLSFYKMYSEENADYSAFPKTNSILDKWILERLVELENTVSSSLDKYELDRAVKPFFEFVDDLSTWYLRRSRDRLKSDEEDKQQALHTLGYVLRNYAKIMAPVAPFLSEKIWLDVKTEAEEESVHLCAWPSLKTSKKFGVLKKGSAVISDMKMVRDLVSVGMEKRSSLGLKVRQPLGLMTVSGYEGIANNAELIEIMKDELNIKDIIFVKAQEKLEDIEFDTVITEELKREGVFRDFTRHVQAMRKKEKMVPDDLIELKVETNEEGREILEMFKDDLEKIAGVKNINYSGSDAEEVIFTNVPFKVVLIK